jgi:hypothetical protein
MTTFRLLIGITAGYGFAIATLFDKFPLIKLAAVNILMTGRM